MTNPKIGSLTKYEHSGGRTVWEFKFEHLGTKEPVSLFKEPGDLAIGVNMGDRHCRYLNLNSNRKSGYKIYKSMTGVSVQSIKLPLVSHICKCRPPNKIWFRRVKVNSPYSEFYTDSMVYCTHCGGHVGLLSKRVGSDE